MKEAISTTAAPQAIGTYSQAIDIGNLVFVSGQIPLDPQTGEVIPGDVAAQVKQVLVNLKAVCEAASLGLEHVVKLTVYLTDLGDFATINKAMAAAFSSPYPARVAVEVSALPKGVNVEMDAILSR